MLVHLPGCIPCKVYAEDTPILTIDSIVICQTHEIGITKTEDDLFAWETCRVFMSKHCGAQWVNQTCTGP